MIQIRQEPGRDNHAAPHPIVLVFHGAEVFDAGDAARLIADLCPVASIVAGVMARTAAAESGLPVMYDGRRPSEILADYRDVPAILVHRAKTPASALRFGSIISSRGVSGDLVMVEPATGTVYFWGDQTEELVSWLGEHTGYNAVRGGSLSVPPPGSRSVGGCLPGEPVFINGVIIGHATSEEVLIAYRDGEIIALSGIKLKEHGVEKLMKTGFSDLASAWCKSGPVRTLPPQRGIPVGSMGRVEVIDHQAAVCYASFDPGLCGLLTIGDDTTSICGHIGCSLGIPVLGITDGDIDGIIPEGYAKGSVVLSAVHELDDDLGSEIIRMVPSHPVDWDEWTESVIRYLGDRVRVVHREV